MSLTATTFTGSQTVDLDGAAARPWDAVVIGAGPAGCIAARELALGGAHVLLLDRKSFPRPKVCGGCVNQVALGTLEALGLGAEIAALGGNPLHDFQARSAGKRVCLPLPGGLAVSRTVFDDALLHAAVQAGVQFLPAVQAELVPLAPQELPATRTVQLTPVGQAVHERPSSPATNAAVSGRAITGSVILIAAGLGPACLQDHPEFDCQVTAGAPVGVGTLVREYPPEYTPGTIFMAVGRAGYVGVVRVEDDQLNLAGAIDPGFLKAHGGPARSSEQILKQAGFPPLARLSESTWRGAVSLTRRVVRPAAHRVLVLGDAAGYVEPFTGEGMAWAITGAVAAAELAQAGRQHWNLDYEVRWVATHRQLVRQKQRWCRTLSTALKYPFIVGCLAHLLHWFPGLATTVIHSLNRPPAAIVRK